MIFRAGQNFGLNNFFLFKVKSSWLICHLPSYFFLFLLWLSTSYHVIFKIFLNFLDLRLSLLSCLFSFVCFNIAFLVWGFGNFGIIYSQVLPQYKYTQKFRWLFGTLHRYPWTYQHPVICYSLSHNTFSSSSLYFTDI